MGFFLPQEKQQLSRLPIAFWAKPDPFAWPPGPLHHHPTLLHSHPPHLAPPYPLPPTSSPAFPKAHACSPTCFSLAVFSAWTVFPFSSSAFWDSNHPSRPSSYVSPSVKVFLIPSPKDMLRVCAPDTFNITTSNPWATIKQVLNVCWALGQKSSMHQCLS